MVSNFGSISTNKQNLSNHNIKNTRANSYKSLNLKNQLLKLSQGNGKERKAQYWQELQLTILMFLYKKMDNLKFLLIKNGTLLFSFMKEAWIILSMTKRKKSMNSTAVFWNNQIFRILFINLRQQNIRNSYLLEGNH